LPISLPELPELRDLGTTIRSDKKEGKSKCCDPDYVRRIYGIMPALHAFRNGEHRLLVMKYARFKWDRNGGSTMLYYALIFFIIAIVAAVFGFGGIAAGAASIAKLLFFIFVIIFVVMLIMGLMRR
jgi:uncharacterized membrane protein YtjA (UPF0391 family)